jgi:3-oxoacyl-[acyl-carrier protein] reductase
VKKKKLELTGRVALVTGGGRGIGRAIAQALAAHGADVAICGRDRKNLDITVESLEAIGVRSRAYAVDARYIHQIQMALIGIKQDFGGLDILVNNIGGVEQFAKFEELRYEYWHEVFETNVMSMVRFSREAFPLLQQSERASVVNIASVAGKRPGNFNPHYGAMKAAMIHVSKHLSNRWGEHGIRVNVIAPHTVKGGAWKRDVANKARMDHVSLAKAEERMLHDVTSKVPLRKIATPQDVADLAVFLASDRSRLITGTCITVDGGTVNSIF